ncbi:MAG: ABC transporter permease [Oscillospiraceae bacterium]|nr:ABC transporter permease [Oscillospiraceae bacterium]
MHKFIIKRLLMLIPVLLGVMFVVFVLGYFSPGDPVRAMLGEAAQPEDIERLRAELGLDDPFFVRYFNFIINAVQGDFGVSYNTQRPVFTEVFARFPNTMQLAAMGIVVAIIVGIPLGIISAVRQYTAFDFGATFFGLLGVSIPNFWLGLMMIVLFAVTLRWLPATGFDEPLQWIMPTIAIATSSSAIIMRMTRSSMLECVRQDYIRTARAKGQKESVVIFRHALRNALIPVATTAGLQFGFLLGGAVLTETIFAIPGLGRMLVSAIFDRDFAIVRGGVLLIAVAFTVVNLAVDVLYAFIDPRIRSQYK